MNRAHVSQHSVSGHGQHGVALVVALLLLIVITLVGLAAVRGTIMQQRMAANQFDRQIAFQSAEAAMRAAQARVANFPADIARNCQAGGVFCEGNPFEDPNLDTSKIITVDSGTGAGQFAASNLATGQPQYVVENMGNWYDPSTSTGYGQSANAHNYGAQGTSTTAVYYRVTARSGNPASAGTGDRAVVVLQAMIKRG
ncbi:PilX N-terminal domain-containing pilus assembly protein [Rhodanobacter sp. AS-Z3]|uniref:pilus assembly PilX family protein n=1 Tax=Rhodanobacter sp. AS-Z3 TaxID=3031330 RepID=UPI002478C830|nr:PilX N-terminal domain-containing pilus assembly protein [Rhodanobacter sp. AS-Z3]WEN16697.1 PilX N-terminal domain-containing pilus assembly protein [Rhodanobacter sp. AS-Z3]